MDAIIAQGSAWGFGNRIFILAANQVLADACGLPLRICWPLNDHCQGRFTDVFRIPAGVSFSDAPLSGEHVVQSDGWNPVDYWSRHQARLACSRDHFLRKVRRKIQLLEWSPDLVEQGLHDLQSHDVDWKECVGVHWRGTDRIRLVRSRSPWEREGGIRISLKRFPIGERLACRLFSVKQLQSRMLSRLRRQISKASRTARSFFVASDDAEIGEEIAEHVRRLGRTVIGFDHQWEPSARRQTSLRASGQDLWALCQCHSLIASEFSSSFLALIAVRSGRHPVNGEIRFMSELYGNALQVADDRGATSPTST